MPHVPAQLVALYAYFVVGLIAAALMPYEVYFYSSARSRSGWTPKDLGLNRLNAIVGFGLGGLLSISLMVVAARGLPPDRRRSRS